MNYFALVANGALSSRNTNLQHPGFGRTLYGIELSKDVPSLILTL